MRDLLNKNIEISIWKDLNFNKVDWNFNLLNQKFNPIRLKVQSCLANKAFPWTEKFQYFLFGENDVVNDLFKIQTIFCLHVEYTYLS